MKKLTTTDKIVYIGFVLIAIGIVYTWYMFANGQFGQH